MDLAEFIRARIDEDEAIAKAAANRHWLTDDNIITLHPEHDGDGFMSWPTRADAQHAANHDPARVLREVEAKRRMVEDTWGGPDHEDMWLHHMRLIASIWSDHPDYQQEWHA